jgi:broad specificity phosphatase PhoE
VRHSKTAKPVDPSFAADQARELTDNGTALAKARRNNLGNPTFSIVGASPAKRAMNTAMLVAGLENTSSIYPMSEFGIFDPTSSEMAKALDNLFATLGYDTVKAYRDAPNGRYVMQHAQVAADAARTLIELVDDQDDPTALLVGHAVFVPAMVYMLAKGNPAVQKVLLNANIGECEGFSFWYGDGKISKFKILGPVTAMVDA